MKKVHVRPKPGVRVAIPGRPREQLPADGMEVVLSAADPYWQRRIDEGDVEVVSAKKSVKKEG